MSYWIAGSEQLALKRPPPLPIAQDGTSFVLMILLKININQKIAVIPLCVDYVWARHVAAPEQGRVEGFVCGRAHLYIT
jgi:hypothetical protein